MDTLGIGIVGCGYWGINYARVFSELPDTTVVTICDLDQERLKRVQQRFPLVGTTTDMGQVVDDSRIAAVVVATPSSTHYEVARRCLVLGKHVLIEKPFVMCVAEGHELIDLATTSPAVLMVGHTFLYNPGIQRMKEFMASDDCGEVYYLHATRTNLGPIRHDANALWDLAPHDVSIFNYLLEQQPVSVTAVGMKSLHNSREDVGFVTLTYPSGILGHIHVSWIDPDKVREVVVVGSKRRIIFNDLNNLERLRIFEKGVAPVADDINGYGEFQLRIRDGDIISPKVDTSEPLKNECSHFIDCIRRQQTPLSDGRHGLDVVRVLVAIDESLKRQGAPVPVL
jgi:predicted dehydrogenase